MASVGTVTCPVCTTDNKRVKMQGVEPPSAFDVKIRLVCDKGHEFSLILESTMRGEIVWWIGVLKAGSRRPTREESGA
jgi:hypothetical protein